MAPGRRRPLPAPDVTLTSAEKQLWAKLPPDRSAIPVLLYHGIGPESDFSNAADASYGVGTEDFAKQMTMIQHAGYETIDLQTFIDFVQKKPVDLPPRPLLLTFDDARADSWTGADGILRKLHFNAVMFVDVGRVDGGDPEYLTWQELADRAGQRALAAAAALRQGPHADPLRPGIPTTTGRSTPTEAQGEDFDGWRERVRSDIEWGQKTLADHIPAYRPLAFAPPYGSYGQDGTNDERIPDDLLGWLTQRYGAVFTQDVNARAKRGSATAARPNPGHPRDHRRRAPREAALRRALTASEGRGLQLVECVGDLQPAAAKVQHQPGRRRRLEHARDRRRDVVARNRTGVDTTPDGDRAGAGIVGQRPRTDDRVSEPALGEVLVRLPLGAQIRPEATIVIRFGIGTHARDDDVARDRVAARDLDQLHRARVVQRPLALGSAARSSTRGEHDGVGATDQVREPIDVQLLEIGYYGLGARIVEIAGMLGVSDQTTNPMPSRGEQLLQPQCDLSVPTRDDDVHDLDGTGLVTLDHAELFHLREDVDDPQVSAIRPSAKRTMKISL